MHWTIPDIIMEQRLKWLGHVGRMNEERLPKKLMFGELRKIRPCHGTRKRWRYLVSQDLQLVDTKTSGTRDAKTGMGGSVFVKGLLRR